MTENTTEQLALFMNARDVRDYGTATWAALDLTGQEAYLTDATAVVAAMKSLGWAEPHAKTNDERGMSAHLRRYQDQAARLCGCSSCQEWLAESARRSAVLESSNPAPAEVEGEPTDAQVEAASRAILPLLDPTWPYDDYDEMQRSKADLHDAVRAALRAAGGTP